MRRREFLRWGAGAAVAKCMGVLALPVLRAEAAPAPRPNVLMIIVDDMNDWVGCLGGHPDVKTPNIDRLAARGTLFTNAHCPAPLCNPCRTAVMTGLRPATTGIYNNNSVWAKMRPDWTTLPRYFKQHGYHVAGGGKIYHHTPKGFNPLDQWDEHFELVMDQDTQGLHVKRLGLDREYFSDMPRHPNGSWDWGPFHADDYEMGDGKCVRWAQDYLARDHEQPFFLTVGLFQPHLPFYAPEKYFAAHPLETLWTPPAPPEDLDDLPPAAASIANAGIDKDFAMVRDHGELKPAIRGYLASIRHADTLVGSLLDALDASEHAENTVVVFWSDHGYHFGEKQRMAKRSLWERSTRVPFAVWAPGVTQPDTRSAAPVDLMAIFPTLIHLCGLPPRNDIAGHSLMPLLRDPASAWEHVALTTLTEGNHAIRTERWRYIRYANGDEELYDHESDTNEWNNLAALPEYGQARRDLAERLDAALGE